MKKLIMTLCAAAALFSFAEVAGAADADWKPLSLTNKEWSDISCPEPRTCYVTAGLFLVGGTGGIAKTTDGGDSFMVQKLPTSNPLHSISCSSASICYAAGDFGSVLKTTDGGENWKEILIGSKANRPALSGIYAIDSQKVMVVGKDTFINRTLDGGETWAPPTLRTFADYLDVFFIDSQRGYITGNDGAYLMTEDGGDSWKPHSGLFGAGSMMAIRGSSGTLYAAGQTLQKSTDGGKTWSKLNAASNDTVGETYRYLEFVNDSTGFVVNGTNLIRKTTDSGATWKAEFTSPSAGILRALQCPAVDFCIAVGGFGSAYRFGTPPAAPPPPPPPAPETPAATTTPATTATTTTQTTESTARRSKAEIEAELQQLLSLAASLMATSKGQAVAAMPKPAPGVSDMGGTTLNRTLKQGAKGDDVKELQRLLASVAGVYPEGTMNGTFGPATLKAVEVFQIKYDLVKPGDPGYGQAGPKTRAKLKEAAKGEAVAPALPETASSVAKQAVLKRTLKKGAKGDDVRKLQEILATDSEVYPEGTVNGVFGPATQKALQRYQEKHGLARPGEAAYGVAGPKTRARLVGQQ